MKLQRLIQATEADSQRRNEAINQNQEIIVERQARIAQDEAVIRANDATRFRLLRALEAIRR